MDSTTSPSFLYRLPTELVEHIVSLACRASAADGSFSANLRLVPDVTTALNLARVSKAFYRAAVKALYGAIRITRPSALFELRSTLVSRPDLGCFVKHLHVGGEASMPPCVWPLAGGTSIRIKTSFGATEEDRLPEWCEPGRSWSLDAHAHRGDCADRAVAGMIATALAVLDLNVMGIGQGRSGGQIGLPLWAARVFELQGVLDLFLVKMQQVERKRNSPLPIAGQSAQRQPLCVHDQCMCYPRLVLSGWGNYDSQSGPAPADSVVLSRNDVWNHLTRRSSDLDSFIHPLTLVNWTALAVNDRRVLSAWLLQQHPTRPTLADLDEPAAVEGGWGNSTEVVRLLSVANLALATGAVVSAASHLRNLSLNGFLDTCLARNVKSSATLRFLSLGPLLPLVREAPVFGPRLPSFPGLQRLLVCGGPLSMDDARCIAGTQDGFPSLEYTQWEVLQSVGSIAEMVGTLRTLRGQIRLYSEDDDAHTSSHEVTARRFEIRLSNRDYTATVALLTTDERLTWLSGGQSSDGDTLQTRIYFVNSDVVDTTRPLLDGVSRPYEHAREWWNRCGQAIE